MAAINGRNHKRMTTPNPVNPGRRLEFIDIIRGFALLGVLIANMSSFSGYSSNPDNYADFLDKAIVIAIQFFVRAKFYSLFSFLFGWGMATQWLRAHAKGYRFTPVFVRRMLILLIFGMIHGMLIWSGDILTLYAILGLALLLFRNRSERTLLLTAVIFLLFTILLTVPGPMMEAFRAWYASMTEFMRWGHLPDSIYATGTYLEIVPKITQDYWTAQSWFIYYVGSVFSMFLLGLYVGKRQIFENVADHLPLFRRTLIIGLIVGILFNFIFVWNTLNPDWVDPRYSRLVGVGSRTIGAPALMLFYVCGLTLLMRRDIWMQRLRPLGSVGRMALSNYLLQSIVCVFIFYGFGLGLYGQTDPTFGLIVTIMLFAAQIRVSGWHLYNHQYGHMEWLWRSLTYGRRQPWRKGENAANLRPNRLFVVLGRINPLITLSIVWVILILWAGGLFMWYRDLNAGRGLGFQLAAQPAATPAPIVTADGVEDTAVIQPIATPQVNPVVYNPGPIAQSGDMAALAAAFDAQQALTQIEILSGEPFNGRRAGSAGGLAAGDYLADQFAESGLQPAGQDVTFFQSFPISYTNLAETPQFVVTLADGSSAGTYELYQDYSPVIRDFLGDGYGAGDVVWMNRCTHDDFGRLDANEKIILCQPEPDSQAVLQAGRYALEHGANGLLLVTNPAQRPPDMGDRYTHPWIPEPIPALRVYPQLVDDLFLDSGTTFSETLQLETPRALETHVEMEVETLGYDVCPLAADTAGCTGRNVLAVLPGRDPNFADEIIVIGAHYDHLGNAPSEAIEPTVWSGANDDASGTAVLLEIARNWQENGYVPRRTVLFAAWDAEELGLLGSIHYIQNPQYLPENVVAMLQLDMVGAGGDILYIDGTESLAADLQAVAEQMEIPAAHINLGRSDHVPFINSGVPAALLIWLDENGNTPDHYHRPADSPDVIDLDKLEAVGKLTATTVLNLAESEPAILTLLAERAAAVTENDLAAFLATSNGSETAIDTHWFNDLQANNPLTVTISSNNLQVNGDFATGDVVIKATYPVTGGVQYVDGILPVEFNRSGDQWQWGGPQLIKVTEENVTISYPPTIEADMTDLATAVADQYTQIAAALGVPTNPAIEVQLLPDIEALRTATGLFLPAEQESWVMPGMIRMVYSGSTAKIAATCRTSSQTCPTDTLTQLALANNGITAADAPWLWQGIPLAWQAENDSTRVQSELLPQLYTALTTHQPIPPAAAAWAETDYALRQTGWDGLLDWQQTDVWQTNWEQRLTAVQADLDQLLAQRTNAILTQDEAAFLATAVAELAPNQRRWLSDLDVHPLHTFEQTAAPLAILEDGSVLAQVTMNYELDGRGPSTAVTDILFMPDAAGYLWAGKQLFELASDTTIVRYPNGFVETAGDIQTKANSWLPRLTALLGISPTLPIEIELYDAPDDLRAAIALPYYATNWTEPDQAIKLQTDADDGVLVTQLTRHLLYQAGVVENWLLLGVPAFVSAQFDGGSTQAGLASNFGDLKTAVSNSLDTSVSDNILIDLTALDFDIDAAQNVQQLGQVEAWDAVRYFVQQQGWQALVARINAANNQPALNDFQTAWLESLGRDHIQPEWVEIATGFDAEAAMATVDFMAAEELGGRLAGTQGAATAAAHIVDSFQAAGLEPAGENGSFYQTVPITISLVSDPPRLEFTPTNGDTTALVYREEFLPVSPAVGGDPVTGALYFMQKEAEYGMVDFDGGIVVRTPALPLEDEIRLAQENGASALILTSFKYDIIDIYGKKPDSLLPTAAIPVLELTVDGYDRLLERFDLDRATVKRLAPIELMDAEALAHFAATPSQQTTTSNILGLLPGSDPFLSQEVVILGGHYDFVGDDVDGRRYSGANDASGVAVMLEIAKLWAETGYQPKRSILFAAWGGQELGNLGSQFYVTNPTLPLTSTTALIQLEGVGGGDGFVLGGQGDEVRDGLLLRGLETAVTQLNQKLVLTSNFSQSDHVSFTGQGFPTLLIAWRLAGEDNLPDDNAIIVKPENLQVSGQTAALLLMSLAQ